MSNNKNFCTGCEKQCELTGYGHWNHPQIADRIICDTNRMDTHEAAIAFAECLCTTCEYWDTFGQPSVVKKRFKIKETCTGCNRGCRIFLQKKNDYFCIQVGHNIVSKSKNKYDAIIRGIKYCRTCPNRTR